MPKRFNQGNNFPAPTDLRDSTRLVKVSAASLKYFLPLVYIHTVHWCKNNTHKNYINPARKQPFNSAKNKTSPHCCGDGVGQ